jgi:hypothetical protein
MCPLSLPTRLCRKNGGFWIFPKGPGITRQEQPVSIFYSLLMGLFAWPMGTGLIEWNGWLGFCAEAVCCIPSTPGGAPGGSGFRAEGKPAGKRAVEQRVYLYRLGGK